MNIKYQLAVFLSLFAAFVAIKDHDLLFIANTVIAVLTAVVVEMVVIYIKRRSFKIHDSAIVSGLIVGFVLADSNRWWLFCIAATVAILSKHLLRIQQKHIFNPAALGIFLSAIIFGCQLQWHGTFLWYILLPAGIYFSYKIRRLEILASYGIVSLGLFGVQALINHINLLTIFGYFSYFYIFIMIIEPKTTPFKMVGKLIFGAGIAIAIFVLYQFNLNFDIELAVLLGFNLLQPWLNKLPERRTV